MTAKSREFQIFAKPVGAACNLKCSYCYYRSRTKLHGENESPVMSSEILERYIIRHIEASTEKEIMFSWHGGEPMMAGIDFYRTVTGIQKKHLPSGRVLMNGIQTNGTLINEEWCSFFARENFIVGISIDGPGELHNSTRRSIGGQPTLNRVLSGHNLLRKHRIPTEILCVVSARNVNYALVVYNFFKQLGVRYVTFLPLVNRDDAAENGVTGESVDPQGFGRFLSEIFDEWMKKDIGTIKIQIFEEAIRSAFNQEHALCVFREKCGGVPVIESNGDFYSCDHYVDTEHLIGNICRGSISSFLDSKRQHEFGAAKLTSLPGMCLNCEVRPMCNGECPRNRFIKTPDGEAGLNYLCEGYRYFFNHIKPFTEAIAEVYRGGE
ncbi:MAG: anaerobic sulfatase maturase [Bacteroidales bacterium]